MGKSTVHWLYVNLGYQGLMVNGEDQGKTTASKSYEVTREVEAVGRAKRSKIQNIYISLLRFFFWGCFGYFGS